jgi:hypothetical protein
MDHGALRAVMTAQTSLYEVGRAPGRASQLRAAW